MLEKSLLPPTASRKTKSPVQLLPETDPVEIVNLRSDILRLLLEIDQYASQKPELKIAIRNRTRESITRHLHYEKDEARLTRMQRDASKLLALWETAN